MNQKPYTYILLRKDINPVQQIVQSSHAALEAGFRFTRPKETSFLIVLEVENQDELIDASKYLFDNDIGFHMFHEPDNSMGYSALCTRAIFEDNEKLLFRKWKLFKSTKKEIS